MKSIIVLLLLLTASAVCGQGEHATGKKTVLLPNPGLMRCESARLWQDENIEPGVVYPLEVTMDHFDEKGCPQGMVITYDRSLSMDDIKESIDRRYAKWGGADNGRIKLYRIEPENLVIQVATIKDSLKETGAPGKKGMRQVIYLSFSVTRSTSAPH